VNTTRLAKCAGVLVALAILSACSGSSSVAPSAGALNVQYVGRTLILNGRPVTAARLSALPRFETIVPDHIVRVRHYEYIFSQYGTYASIFDYPKSLNQIGSIQGDGGQGCTNVLFGYGKGIMWNIGGDTQITEYKVPKTPIKTLKDSVGMPSSCAMNASGDLAVGILAGTDAGSVIIFRHASGSGKVYPTELTGGEYFDGYDNQGDLFADGFAGSGFQLDELPKGANKFQTVKLPNTVQFPGSVQWDGKYVTVLDQQANAIYQYTISGAKATLKGTVKLTGSSDCAQGWIVPGIVYCGDFGNNGGEIFRYPAGGSPIAIFKGNFAFPLGVTAAQN
jgi:hypothetical protein